MQLGIVLETDCLHPEYLDGKAKTNSARALISEINEISGITILCSSIETLRVSLKNLQKPLRKSPVREHRQLEPLIQELTSQLYQVSVQVPNVSDGSFISSVEKFQNILVPDLVICSNSTAEKLDQGDMKSEVCELSDYQFTNHYEQFRTDKARGQDLSNNPQVAREVIERAMRYSSNISVIDRYVGRWLEPDKTNDKQLENSAAAMDIIAEARINSLKCKKIPNKTALEVELVTEEPYYKPTMEKTIYIDHCRKHFTSLIRDEKLKNKLNLQFVKKEGENPAFRDRYIRSGNACYLITHGVDTIGQLYEPDPGKRAPFMIMPDSPDQRKQVSKIRKLVK